ncbi:MAG: aldo/keto reductase [Bacteroidales bacterium]|jgi:aryl-alcohol dehydrogenase-like predicted oxidoreductase|nr:aldo/keto reductase [Bacteroidales bacterium]
MDYQNMKLCLGTAQFGLAYGINNKQGKVHHVEVERILRCAYKNDITLLDTASAYGESELILGEVKNKINKEFKIITKYPANQQISPFIWINCSLEKMHVKKVYGYLFHNYSIFQEHPEYIEDMLKIKESGKAKKIGFSLYYPTEIEYILQNNIPCDIVQVPYNIFDQRFENIFPDIKSRGVEIHIRSIFLQGLLFIHPDKLDEHFTGIRHLLHELSDFSTENKLSISALCLGFVNANKYIDKIIIGVDSVSNLKENIHNYNSLSNITIDYQQFKYFSITDENIILPFQWKK